LKFEKGNAQSKGWQSQQANSAKCHVKKNVHYQNIGTELGIQFSNRKVFRYDDSLQTRKGRIETFSDLIEK